MKGLLLKDLYMVVKYCKAYLLIAVVFLAVSLMGSDNLFFIFYPCLLCGMIPVNLLAYDERSRWPQYCGTLPYTKGQIVSGKYLIGLIAQLVMLLVTGIAQGIRMHMNGSFEAGAYISLILLIFALSAVASSICMPFVFKFGVEKGRIAYYVTVGLVCAAAVILPAFLNAAPGMSAASVSIVPVFAVCMVIYALSWLLSVEFYNKRELG